MQPRAHVRSLSLVVALLTLAAGGPGCSGTGRTESTASPSGTGGGGPSGVDPASGPPAGNPNPEATCAVPAEASLEDVSRPTSVVGTGTADSCTSDAFVDAVARGGVVTFDCGREPVTIRLTRTAKVFNDRFSDAAPRMVIDGGGLVTLSGGGARRILYMNTCDPDQVWVTDHCDDQSFPQLTVQNLTFLDGDSSADAAHPGGGAIYASGGRLKVINSRFFGGACAATGPDVSGAAIWAFEQYHALPAYVVKSTFGGAEGFGGACSNGGGIGSIGVSWTIVDSLFSYNRATGNGGNPQQGGTPGGGSGGAIYNDGDDLTLSLCGTRIEHNEVNAYGSAIFFVDDDDPALHGGRAGEIDIDRSVITGNTGGSWYPTYPQISNHDYTPIVVTDSVIQ